MMRRRRGFTLLEVILTMLIAGLLIAAVAAALRIHLRLVDSGRAEVEQAQLARALLRRIADDLRSAVPVVVETSGASAGASTDDIAAASSALGGSGSSGGAGSTGSSGSSSSGGSSASIQNITGSVGVTDIGGSTSSGSTSSTSSGGSSFGTGGSSTGSGMQSGQSGGSSSGSSSGSSGSSSGSSSSSTDGSQSTADSSSEESTQPPGVYGTQYDLQIDVSRLPRSGGLAAPTGAAFDPTGASMAVGVEPPSDVKTVGYYVSSIATGPAPPITDPGTAAPIVPTGGLVRRQVPREAALYSATTGGLDAAQYEQLLAEEVTGLEFRYYDGTEWLTEWDSSTRQALPVCVEIALTMRSPDTEVSADPTSLPTGEPTTADRTYRLLVHLPGGEPSTAEATTTESTETTSTETSP